MYEEIKPLQIKQLQILKELKKVCDKNHIQYFLFYGTLIGAVRHKGFIPWDDDIDIAMTYDNYLRFYEACKNDLCEDYFLQSFYNQPESGLTFMKLRMNSTTLIIDNMADRNMHHGIDIDIYPIYNIADTKFKRKIQFFNASLYLLLCVQELPKHSSVAARFFAKIILMCCRGKLRKRLREHCHKKMAKYENSKTKYKSLLFGSPREFTRIFPAILFDETTTLQFEDDVFSVPKNYDECLKIRYGDYLTLPPEEERKVKLEHIILIDTDNSYIKYKGEYYCKNS